MEINFNASKNLFAQALKLFPGGVNSPVRDFSSVGGSPLFIKKGKGAKIWDEDDNPYIDYCCSWGALILGHAHGHVVDALQQAIAYGTSFGTCTLKENTLASLCLQGNKKIEKIRFVNSGTEATMSAIRLARGYTKKDKILKFSRCYHGHADALLVNAGSGLAAIKKKSSAGLPHALLSNTLVAPLMDLDAVDNILSTYENEVAAIIIEPLPANYGLIPLDKAYLMGLSKISKRYGCLLIFDEVISGFRTGLGAMSKLLDIEVDLITYGKIIGGGLPVGAYGGKAQIMDYVAPLGKVYQAGTLSGNPLAMTAGIANLEIIKEDNFFQHLNQRSQTFVRQLEDFVNDSNMPLKIFSFDSIFWISFMPEDKENLNDLDIHAINKYHYLHNSLLKKGVYFPPSPYEVCFISDAHTPNILSNTLDILSETLSDLFKKF